MRVFVCIYVMYILYWNDLTQSLVWRTMDRQTDRRAFVPYVEQCEKRVCVCVLSLLLFFFLCFGVEFQFRRDTSLLLTLTHTHTHAHTRSRTHIHNKRVATDCCHIQNNNNELPDSAVCMYIYKFNTQEPLLSDIIS